MGGGGGLFVQVDDSPSFSSLLRIGVGCDQPYGLQLCNITFIRGSSRGFVHKFFLLTIQSREGYVRGVSDVTFIKRRSSFV